jgi:hypothetical protein
MSIFGKISVGIDKMLKAPRIRIRNAKTTKVYGRRRASRTIHIRLVLAPEPVYARLDCILNDSTNVIVQSIPAHRVKRPKRRNRPGAFLRTYKVTLSNVCLYRRRTGKRSKQF